jgi:hypothetical protein
MCVSEGELSQNVDTRTSKKMTTKHPGDVGRSTCFIFLGGVSVTFEEFMLL